MSWKLFIDDQYDDPETPSRHPPDDFIPARNSREAIDLTIKHGIPSFISFDHDYGDDDDAMFYIDWLINNYYDSPVPEFIVHSANHIGGLNIISKMNSWKKSQPL